jgi:hypothetical protein
MHGQQVAAADFRASPDDYTALKLLIDGAFGSPAIRRSSVSTELGPRPQVSLTWRASGHVIRLTDPAPPDLGILVRISS